MEGSGEKETLLPSPPLPLLPLFFGGKGGGSHSNFHAIACMQILANAIGGLFCMSMRDR